MRLTRHFTEKEFKLFSKKYDVEITDYCNAFNDKENPDKDVYNKLGQLEDIEESFGCDFILLNQICENGVYCYKRSIKSSNANGKRLGEIIHIQNSDIHIEFFGVHQEKRMGVSIMGCIDFCYHSLPIKDYGKTWALTKEELK